jgi:two-component system NtrC family sensor kinase
VFYFLLILRGFTLFEKQREGVVFHLLILVLYTFSTWFGTRSFEFLLDRRFILNLFLIWMVILMSWYIMEIIRKQHGDLARIRENLVRSESLAIVGEMAASVAHEINNPVGIILAYSEFMLRQSKAGDPQREDLQILAEEAKRCKSIVSELLDFSRASHPTVSQPADMCVLNDEVLRFVFHDRSNRNIRITKNYEEAPPVLIDPVQIKQALVNVYLNAKQALENVGDIEVSIRAVDPAQKRVSLRIANGGDPIRDEVIDRAFEPFYTSKERGTGLGLSITHRIVEAHQGDIQIGRNANQEGAYVEITLPALAPRTTA